MIINERGIGLVSGPMYRIMKVNDPSQVRHTLEGNSVFRMEAHQHSLGDYTTPIYLSNDLGGNRLMGSGTQVIRILFEYYQEVTFGNVTPSPIHLGTRPLRTIRCQGSL